MRLLASNMLVLMHAGVLGQTPVWTYHNDNLRTGQNTNETITPANVSSGQFHKLFSLSVDDNVYAQPLYIPNLHIVAQGVDKGIHNVVFVATEHDTVYAFDADNNLGANSSPLWFRSLMGIGEGPVSTNDIQQFDPSTGQMAACTNIFPDIGITGTPVIDTNTNVMYVVAKSKKADGTFVQRLHALNITTGSEVSSPVDINGSTVASDGRTIPFDSLHALNRSALLLANSRVYVAFASHCDFLVHFDPNNGANDIGYHGWIFAYDAATLQQRVSFATTHNFTGGFGGIWMAGAGLAADSSGNIFAAVGNGDFDTSHVFATDFGDSIVKLDSNLKVLDYFTPMDQLCLEEIDGDLGSGGVLLLPDATGFVNHAHLLIQTGKEGTIRVIDRDNMGRYIGSPPNPAPSCSVQLAAASDTQIPQEIPNAVPGGMWSIPTYWNNNIYFGGAGQNNGGPGDPLIAFSIPANSQGSSLIRRTDVSSDTYHYSGVNMSVSANGGNSGILWAYTPVGGRAVLKAYDALNLGSVLYSGVNEDAGAAINFAVPTVANGKVYAGAQGQLAVYGVVPTVQLTNQTRPGNSNLEVGDSFQVVIHGIANQPVSVSGSQNRVSFGPTSFGNTDANGNLTITGTEATGNIGSWTEVWQAGGVPAPPLAFNVSQNDSTFIQQQYSDFLDRAPSASELSSGLSALSNGTTRGAFIAQTIFLSQEFASKGKFVAQAYRGLLVRDADYNGFRFTLNNLDNGGSQLSLVQQLINSQEFQTNFGSNLSNSQFATVLYQNVLLRPPDSGGLAFYTNQLNNGASRESVALQFLQSTEFMNLTASQNHVLIDLIYVDMLRRTPDQAGATFWFNQLNSGVSLTTIPNDFLTGSEYGKRLCGC